MIAKDGQATPEGVTSLLDTDLYKLTMQCAVLKHFPDEHVAYAFTNRTPHMRLSSEAFAWLQAQVEGLGHLRVTQDELAWLKKTCPYFSSTYLDFLESLQLRPSDQLELSFDTSASQDGFGDLYIKIKGLWTETILYEIPLLALVSEAYFKFVDTDWNHDRQVEIARDKGMRLLQAGCVFSEFGSRRRRDYKTHESVMKGLAAAAEEAKARGLPGKFSGTSNVHFAMRFGVDPIGTVAHEWFMGIAALKNDYYNANEAALECWVDTYGPGVLGVALTDTFGTPSFLRAFAQPVPARILKSGPQATYAQIFTGVRQDSGDPLDYVKMFRRFYQDQGIHEAKTITYSDSLDVEKCIKYKAATDAAGLIPSFGVGTHFTNDFTHLSSDRKSVPLNIVIKLSEANGSPAVKLSDNQGKNMGPKELVAKVKQEVGYTEKSWTGGDEAHRWDGK